MSILDKIKSSLWLNVSNYKEKKLLEEDNFDRNTEYNVDIMLTNHCRFKCKERWISIDDAKEEFKLLPEYEYSISKKYRNYRMVANKYVFHIWYNWAIITIYPNDKELRDAKDKIYTERSRDKKQKLFTHCHRWIIRDSISCFRKSHS